MNPQNNNVQMGGGQPVANQNFDGFGGPNISYENYNDQQAMQPAQQAPVQPAINVVNANGVISGRKMVDYLWQRIAYCALAFSGVLLIGLIVSVVLVGNANGKIAKAESERDSYMRNTQGIYDVLGVDSQEAAIKTLNSEKDFLNGGDLAKIDNLLSSKYGISYQIDFASSNINLVKVNDIYKVVSVGISQASGTVRVVLYEKIADGEWKLGGFDSTNKTDPCANSSDEEKDAISGVFTCGKAIDDDKETVKTEEKKDEE